MPTNENTSFLVALSQTLYLGSVRSHFEGATLVVGAGHRVTYERGRFRIENGPNFRTGRECADALIDFESCF